MHELTITVVVPTISKRVTTLLPRALKSIDAQTRPPDEVIVVEDVDGDGAPITRQRGLDKVTTTHVAFLDDDDEFYPHHLEALEQVADHTLANYVYPWFKVKGGHDPFPHHFGKPWDPDNPHQTTITTLVDANVARSVGGFTNPTGGQTPGGNRYGEDYAFTLAVNRAGYKIVHLPERTWIWHHHANNTSGRPDQW